MATDRADTQDRLDDWVQGAHPRIAGLADFQLPADFSLDFSADSLPRLEAEVLARFDDPAELTAPAARPFLDAVTAYLGETLLRVTGGRWIWKQLPLAKPDEALGLSATDPFRLVAAAVQCRDGEEFSRVYAAWAAAAEEHAAARPSWAPAKAYTPGVDPFVPTRSEHLDAWLAEREREFPAWVARYGADGAWDFSPASLDALVTAVFRETPTDTLFEAPEHATFSAGAEWYWGEVLRRAAPSQWVYKAGARDGTSPYAGYCYLYKTENKGSCTPALNLAYMIELDDRDYLRDLYDAWAHPLP
ncbi:hypothetical protein ACFQZZ_07905 [Nocardia sp. GCM10030253]|uniref:hypothetical protein n=1 Tax=Nocardia sp. GCM10030253 TaxID=3273404 RepID=UPI00362BFB55